MDSFAGHGYNNHTGEFSDEMIQFANDNNLALVLIPPGTTPFLQVGDTHMHSAFKSSLARQWDEFTVDLLERGESIHALDIDKMRKWIAGAVVKAAESINDPDLIQRSFLDNGLSNDLSGGQEDLVHTAKDFLS